MTTEIRLSGSGGQGLQLSGRVLAEALGVFEGKNVVQSSAYGGQVRGGSSRSDVLVSSSAEEVDFPEVMNADILLAMTQEAVNEYSGLLKPDGIMIIDTTFVKDEPKTRGRIVSFPFTLYTKERLGSQLPTNMVVVAVIAQLGKLLKKESLAKAIKEIFPKDKGEMNLRALDLGYELVESGTLQERRNQ
jgi:2-oxoglutarate ferredoxin oxidoreductase subunit gamma